MSLNRRIVIVTPNISEQMGGEAIKAFQFLRYLTLEGQEVTVVTHRRSADVLVASFKDIEVRIVEDTFGQILVWKTVILRSFIASFFFLFARRIVRELANQYPEAVFHYLCPVSPILPRFPVQSTISVLGPLTGNIYYPPAFRGEEPVKDKIRRTFHYLAQRISRAVSGDKRLFWRVLVSGGERTRRSLAWAGCSASSMNDVIDSGISSEFDLRPVIRHEGVNTRFMTSGRLVPHKGVQLTIEALQYVTKPIVFDVYGDGYHGDELRRLAERLGVADKVRFLGWMTSHDALIARMAEYRGYMVPSLAEANGIVVQEAMMAGLPAVCLKWGGPAMLATDAEAILIEPLSREHVVRELARAMDELSEDTDRANAIAHKARQIAERRFTWASVAAEWQRGYDLAAVSDRGTRAAGEAIA